MAIVKMQKISVCAAKKNRKAVLEMLQSLEMMEIHTEDICDEDLTKMDTQSMRVQFEKNADAFDQALNLLNQYAPVKSGGLSLFSEKKSITRKAMNEIIIHQLDYLQDAKDILKMEKELQECKGSILKDQNMMETLQPWMKLDVPMITEGTEKTSFLLGTVPGLMEESQIYAAAAQHLKEPTALSVQVLSSGNDQTCIAVLCLKAESGKAEEGLRSVGFARLGFLTRYTPEEKCRRCTKDIEDQQAQIRQLEEQIRSYGDKREQFKATADYYRTRAEKYRVLGTIPQSGHVFFLEGWVPAEQAEPIAALLSQKFDAIVEKEEKREDEVEPTQLKNNKWSAMVEGILESYGLPQHGKVDPTFIMSIFYVFFFGMMLSDAGYGILMMIFCGVVLARHKHLERGMHQMIQLFFWCGLSTAFWGFMYGGFFGDALDVIASTFFGYTGSESIMKPIWFEPLTNPMKLLIFCMLFGVIHLFAGLAIKGYEYLKDGDVVGFVSEILSWYLFLMGLILILLPTSLFEGIAQMQFNFPGFVGPLAKLMTLAGALLILVMAERSQKNWALRILLGAYDIYGVTSWLSDVLSYSRLLALGLATGVIANVVNMMGSMFGGGPVGAIAFIIIFVFGHTLNFAINLLGAYVHTNRLQYVEFFGKFYDGGGIPFRPFKSVNKYVEIKEEQ